jgi:hypothetical protein
MFNPWATDANKPPEPPLPHPGAPPDTERAKNPPLPQPRSLGLHISYKRI